MIVNLPDGHSPVMGQWLSTADATTPRTAPALHCGGCFHSWPCPAVRDAERQAADDSDDYPPAA